MNRPYRPSNGTEGASFIEHFCFHCERDRHEDCPIVAETFLYDADDPKYPKEWIHGHDGPECTAFIPLDDPVPKPRCTQTIDMFPEPQGD